MVGRRGCRSEGSEGGERGIQGCDFLLGVYSQKMARK